MHRYIASVLVHLLDLPTQLSSGAQVACHVQVIDDSVGRTLASASTLSKDLKESLTEVGTANKVRAVKVSGSWALRLTAMNRGRKLEQ